MRRGRKFVISEWLESFNQTWIEKIYLAFASWFFHECKLCCLHRTKCSADYTWKANVTQVTVLRITQTGRAYTSHYIWTVDKSHLSFALVSLAFVLLTFACFICICSLHRFFRVCSLSSPLCICLPTAQIFTPWDDTMWLRRMIGHFTLKHLCVYIFFVYAANIVTWVQVQRCTDNLTAEWRRDRERERYCSDSNHLQHSLINWKASEMGFAKCTARHRDDDEQVRVINWIFILSRLSLAFRSI